LNLFSSLPLYVRCSKPGLRRLSALLPVLLTVFVLLCAPSHAFGQNAPPTGGEANLVLPDLGQANFLGGTNGRTQLMWGMLICGLGL